MNAKTISRLKADQRQAENRSCADSSWAHFRLWLDGNEPATAASGMIEATTQGCPHCHGTGLIRSDDNLALAILRQVEEEGVRRRSREVVVTCPVGIANFLMNQKREHIGQIEARYGLAVRVEGDPSLVSPNFSIEKLKTATRVISEPTANVVSVDSKILDEIDAEAEGDEDDAQDAAENEEVDAGYRGRTKTQENAGAGGGGASPTVPIMMRPRSPRQQLRVTHQLSPVTQSASETGQSAPVSTENPVISDGFGRKYYRKCGSRRSARHWV